uniref:Uncharacterized protein n=1 Tax=Arundo donax TaxID=35708 RepID=A0A0A9FA01_ARUDO
MKDLIYYFISSTDPNITFWPL